jgi:hypothetical protein
MNEKKMVSRSVAIVLGIVCIILGASLGGIFAYYVPLVNDKNNIISSLNAQIATKDSQISQLSSNATNLQTQLNDLTSILELNKYEVGYNTSALESPYNLGLTLPANFSSPDVIGSHTLNWHKEREPDFGTYGGVALVQVSSNYDTYVNITYSWRGYDFYNEVHVGMNGTAAFVVLPSPSRSVIFITVYTNDTVTGATAIITITYTY